MPCIYKFPVSLSLSLSPFLLSPCRHSTFITGRLATDRPAEPKELFPLFTVLDDSVSGLVDRPHGAIEDRLGGELLKCTLGLRFDRSRRGDSVLVSFVGSTERCRFTSRPLTRGTKVTIYPDYLDADDTYWPD